MIVHQADYARNTATGLWRARCAACGWWERRGSQEYVTSQFAIHDIERWEAVEVEQPAVTA